MKITLAKSCLVGLLGATSLAMGATPIAKQTADKIDSRVVAQLESANFASQGADILIQMTEKADLSGAGLLGTKAAKGRYVFNALTETANASQADLVKYLKSKGADYERYFIANLVAVYGADRAMIDTIAARSDVAKIYGDTPFRGVPNLANIPEEPGFLPAMGPEQSLKEVGAVKVWEELKIEGQNVVIAGQDTGVQWDHPALKSKYRGMDGGRVNHDYNWHDAIKRKINGGSSCGINSKTPCDDNGHGTHTVGTIVGSAGRIQIGMAPKAKWIACRNMDNGDGRPTTYIGCYQFFLAPTPVGGNPFTTGIPEKAPHVINNSWGCPKKEKCTGDEMIDVLKSIQKAGIVNVTSAGNDGSSCGTIKSQPATHTELSLNVGAYNSRNGKIASFSSRGPSTYNNKIGPDVAAPGVRINSAIPGDKYSSSFSGTSMAGPHVAGQVALMISANEALSGQPVKIEEIITSTARAKTTNQSCAGTSGRARPNNTYGYGNIDAYASVKKGMEVK